MRSQSCIDGPLALTATFGQNYYVAPTAEGGSDSHDGSEASPFATVEHAIEVASALAGSAVYVKPGTYMPAVALTLNSPMTLIGINDADGKRPTIEDSNGDTQTRGLRTCGFTRAISTTTTMPAVAADFA